MSQADLLQGIQSGSAQRDNICLFLVGLDRLFFAGI